MPIGDFYEKEISDFRGAREVLDNVEYAPHLASSALNTRFLPGSFFSRPGVVVKNAVAGKVTSIYGWITSRQQRLVYFLAPNLVKMIDLVGGTLYDVFTASGSPRAASVAEAAQKTYISTYDTSGQGTSQVRIADPLGTGQPADKAFAAPWSATPVITDTGVGLTTAGVHKFGYIIETRTGFLGPPGPVTSGVFTPFSYTVAGGSRSLLFNVTANTPPDAAFLHVIMTPAGNDATWYFVPGAVVAVPGGATGWPNNVTISYSDEDLALNAVSALDNFSFLTQDAGGNGPITPSVIVPYGNRLCYLVDNKWYISDPYEYQQITEDLNTVQVEGQRSLTTGFVVGGVFYSIGSGWTYASIDMDDAPRTWAAPKLISGKIGTTAVEGVAADVAGQYAWVASPAGLYRFTGQYDEKPLSYLQKDWARINWNAPYAVKVVDDHINRMVRVAAPLDGATEPTHILTFDYTRGTDPEDVDYSLDSYAAPFSSIGMVQDVANAKKALWLGPQAAGNFLKEDVAALTDNGAAIHTLWESGMVLTEGDPRSKVNLFGGLHVNAVGSGTLKVTAFGLNRARSIGPRSLALSAAPGVELLTKMDLKSENFTVRFEVNSPGDWLNISGVTLYHRPWLTQR